jgi:molybdenum cofactor cytidylyltransferase
MLAGERLLERAIRIASDVCDSVIVVLGANAELIQRGCDLGGVTVVLNEDWMAGMGSSIRAGVKALGTVDGVVLMTCDMPAVTAEHLRRIAEAGHRTASAYAGRRGVPAYFPASAFAELERLKPESGAQSLLKAAPCVELELGEVDVDTMEDLDRARDLFDGSASPLSGEG